MNNDKDYWPYDAEREFIELQASELMYEDSTMSYADALNKAERQYKSYKDGYVYTFLDSYDESLEGEDSYDESWEDVYSYDASWEDVDIWESEELDTFTDDD